MIYSFIDIQINRTLYLLRKSRNIVLIGHRKPDSDTIGSMLALNLALKKQAKKNILCACVDPIPKRFRFLPGATDIFQLENVLDKIKEADLIVTLDCGSYELTGLSLFSQIRTFLINIDHHQDSSFFGNINIVKGNTSSTSEIIYEILNKAKISIDKDMATCLLAGIFGDTDSFKNVNTTNRTLTITSHLLAVGANLKQITRHTLQDKSLSTLRLWGRILSRIKKHEDFNIISAVITQEDLAKTHALEEDLEGIANFLNSIPDVRASIILTERRNGEIKGSLRTLNDKVDVSKLARLLGGGGHKKAAGFTLLGKLKKEKSGWKILIQTDQQKRMANESQLNM